MFPDSYDIVTIICPSIIIDSFNCVEMWTGYEDQYLHKMMCMLLIQA